MDEVVVLMRLMSVVGIGLLVMRGRKVRVVRIIVVNMLRFILMAA